MSRIVFSIVSAAPSLNTYRSRRVSSFVPSSAMSSLLSGVEGHGFPVRCGRNARTVLAAQFGKDALSVHPDEPVRIAAADVHHAYHGRTEPLQHPDLLHMSVGIRGEDGHRLELLVRHVLSLAADLRRVSDRIGVMLVDERPLPLARALERLLVARSPARKRLEDDLARFAPGLLGTATVRGD